MYWTIIIIIIDKQSAWCMVSLAIKKGGERGKEENKSKTRGKKKMQTGQEVRDRGGTSNDTMRISVTPRDGPVEGAQARPIVRVMALPSGRGRVNRQDLGGGRP